MAEAPSSDGVEADLTVVEYHSSRRSYSAQCKTSPRFTPRSPMGRQAFTGRYMLEYPRMAHYLTNIIC